MKILITGLAGFIGYHLAKSLHKIPCCEIIGIDNLNDYYDTQLKHDRLKDLGIIPGSYGEVVKSNCTTKLDFVVGDLNDKKLLDSLFKQYEIEYVINLAAQAGVRYSIDNPRAYIDSNISAFMNLLEVCRANLKYLKHLIYASSSSVYGLNSKIPFSINDNTNSPASLYAATKKSNELMAHVYSHLYKIPTSGLRFFTVYGPWGRPDMSYFSFTKSILEGKAIDVYNHGEMRRDFTFIDDVINVIIAMIDKPPLIGSEVSSSNSSLDLPYRIINIGNNSPVKLLDFIYTLQTCLGVEAKMNFLPMQKGDVYETYADIDKTKELFSITPSIKIQEGLRTFVNWYKSYYSE